MSGKFLIFGATGSIGSALANLLYNDKVDCHLVARNEDELIKISSKLGFTYSVCDILNLDFVNDLKKDFTPFKKLLMMKCFS